MSTPEVFHFKDNVLYCEDINILKLRRELENSANIQQGSVTPFFIYSSQQIRKNINDYLSALDEAGLKQRTLLGFALKANGNPHLVKLTRLFGCNVAVAVSGYEIQLALDTGFSGENIIYNGNGKQT